jgi:ABC-2 type transport system permease protein/lipopolysaccharide transport system permease protein
VTTVGETSVDAHWTVNAPRRGTLFPVGDIWRSREIMLFFALRDLRVRYKQAVLGVVWVIAQPVITVLTFMFVFDRLADVDSQGLAYPVFALVGLLAWTYVSQCVSRGSEVLVGNPSLITKVYFPRITAPLASLLPPAVDLIVGLALLVPLCIYYGVGPSPALLLLPLWLALLALTALGPTCFLAALNVRYRDVRQIVPPVLQALLFLSPVGYSSMSLDGTARTLYALNPVVGPLELGRFVLVGGQWPGNVLFLSCGVAVLLALGGLAYFQHAARHFADVI